MPTETATTCVIGDIHGCVSSLNRLLQMVVPRADTFVFLGDYVDRGANSKQVVETILRLRQSHPRTITLLGNHDFLFLQHLSGLDNALFLHVGGKQTLASYGLSPEAEQKEITRLLPSAHRAFFTDLPMHWEDRHAIYVHAGLQPGRHLSQQTAQWCLWARENFLRSSCDFGKPVIFGHTVFAEPYVATDKIGIDTGAVYGGRLTALLLPAMEFISVPGEPPMEEH